MEQRLSLDKLIQAVTKQASTEIGKTNVAQHVIEVFPGTKPIKQRYYPVSPYKQEIINAEIEHMLASDIIEPSKSPWSSPVCLVRKKIHLIGFVLTFENLIR